LAQAIRKVSWEHGLSHASQQSPCGISARRMSADRMPTGRGMPRGYPIDAKAEAHRAAICPADPNTIRSLVGAASDRAGDRPGSGAASMGALWLSLVIFGIVPGVAVAGVLPAPTLAAPALSDFNAREFFKAYGRSSSASRRSALAFW
jgi:hypothetical protein